MKRYDVVDTSSDSPVIRWSYWKEDDDDTDCLCDLYANLYEIKLLVRKLKSEMSRYM